MDFIRYLAKIITEDLDHNNPDYVDKMTQDMKGWLGPTGIMFIGFQEHGDYIGDPDTLLGPKVTDMHKELVRRHKGHDLSQYASLDEIEKAAEKLRDKSEDWYIKWYDDWIKAAVSQGLVRVSWPTKDAFLIQIPKNNQAKALTTFREFLKNSPHKYVQSKKHVFVDTSNVYGSYAGALETDLDSFLSGEPKFKKDVTGRY